ncbi:hypothetical protein M3Y98_01206200 [Aphelenchoides besseyi]|nr:hypothetical protein M3Y98_01206200 [Aphelenchoides besseyi]
MNCFAVNETTERNVLEYANDLEISAQIRIIRYQWNLVFTSLGMILNALVCIAILRFPNPAIKINPLLLCHSIIDFLFALIYFLFGRYLFVGYNRVYTVYDGIVQVSGPIVLLFINLAMIVILIASWNITIAQFLYRHVVVVCFFFLLFCFLFVATHLYTMLGGFSAPSSSEDIEESVVIIRHYGYDVQPFSVFGKRPDPQPKAVQVMPLFFSLFGFFLILCFAIATRRTLRQSAGMKVAVTRKLNDSMDKTLLCMGAIPLISIVLPTVLTSALTHRCESNAVPLLFTFTCSVCAPFFNSIVTLIFIRHYRNAILQLITFGYWEQLRRSRSSVLFTSNQ